MTLPAVSFETRESIFQSIEEVADSIATKTVLKINDIYYRIVDFEFYIYTKDETFRDPYTYKGDLQLQRDRLYLHNSGIDITFGDGINHGGILLRGILKIYKDETQGSKFVKQYFKGPRIVARELLSSLYPLNGKEKNEINLVNVNRQLPENVFPVPVRIVTTKRVNLTEKPADTERFCDELLRYIVVIPNGSGFGYKIPGVENLLKNLLKEGKITSDEVTTILGYKRKFL